MIRKRSEVNALTGYQELAKLIIFSISDVEVLTKNRKTAYSLVYRLMNKGLVKKIRNNMYSCVNPVTGKVIANKFQIACASSNSAYISHYSAFEYYGLSNKQYSVVHVSSASRFRDYEFEGIKYKYIASKSPLGVIQPKELEMIRITNIEKTVVDGIKDIDRLGELKSLLEYISKIDALDTKKIITYLDDYKIQSLFQKTGFILEYFLTNFKLADGFYDYCKECIGKSTSYLNKDAKNNGEYIKEWKIIIPKYILENDNQSENKCNVNLR